MVVLAIDRIAGEIAQAVIHPAHVPLVAEPKPAFMDRHRHARKCGAFLGHRHDPRRAAIGGRVHCLEKLDRFEVFAPAKFVGHPFAGRARIVAIEHRGHRIHAQAVEVILLEPEERVGEQVIRDLAPPVIVDQRVPVLMETLLGVGMFIKRRAVEPLEPVIVGREMPRHPVQDDAEAAPVRRIDEFGEFLGAAMADGRRIKADGLITPRSVERVLGDRQQLDMGEAHVAGVIDELFGQFVI